MLGGIDISYIPSNSGSWCLTVAILKWSAHAKYVVITPLHGQNLACASVSCTCWETFLYPLHFNCVLLFKCGCLFYVMCNTVTVVFQCGCLFYVMCNTVTVVFKCGCLFYVMCNTLTVVFKWSMYSRISRFCELVCCLYIPPPPRKRKKEKRRKKSSGWAH